MNDTIITLENINLTSGKSRLTSPRSVEALERLGMDLEELYFMDFKNFKLANPDLLNIAEQFQKSRYETFERRRQSKLEEALKVKSNILIYCIIHYPMKFNNHTINPLLSLIPL